MQPEQSEIYYVLADNRRGAESSPHLDPFKARKLEVLYFIEPVDSFVAVSLTEFGGKKLRNVDDPDIALPPLAEEEAQPGRERFRAPSSRRCCCASVRCWATRCWTCARARR